MGILVAVAIVAGVRGSELDGKIGPRNTKAVIVSDIDDHVGPRLHVTRQARGRRINAGVMAMTDIGIFVGHMALQTDAFAREPKFRAVRLVAVAAGDAGCEHPALLEWRIIIGLLHIADLSVDMVGAAPQRFDHVSLG